MYKLLLLLLVVVISCQKNTQSTLDNPYGLPNATQTGVNMFACRINGHNVIVQDPEAYYFGCSFNYNNSRDTMGVSVTNKLQDTLISPIISIGFKIMSTSTLQVDSTYSLSDTSKAFAQIITQFSPCGMGAGYGNGQFSYATSGSVTITKISGGYKLISGVSSGYDPNAIVSGTFNFIIPINGCDTIKVTDGRFDINYSQY